MNLIIAAMHAYNEERAIAKMVLGCKKYVDKVVLVDDGSTDATAKIAEARAPMWYGILKTVGTALPFEAVSRCPGNWVQTGW